MKFEKKNERELIFKSEFNSIDAVNARDRERERDAGQNKNKEIASHILHVFEIFSLFVVDGTASANFLF